jgi:CheY-like chemotaxis protein
MWEVDDKPTRPTMPASTAGGIALLAEDETSVRLITRRMLERLGYRVIEAADGLSAIARFKENAKSIDVVLLDITMPGMSGEDVLAELRRLRPELRVVVASGHEEQEIAARLNGLGASGFIQKPFSMEALAAVLKSTVQGDG